MLSQILKVLQTRPLFLFQYVRTRFLFQRTRFLIHVLKAIGFYPKHIYLGPQTQIQRLRCVRNEEPNASITLGERCTVYEFAQIEAYGSGKIQIGNHSIIGDTRIYSRASIIIGQRFLSSWNTFIQDFDPHPLHPQLRRQQVEQMCGLSSTPFNWTFPTASITLGDDIWMGANSTILKGAQIESGCIIAANSVVVAGHYPKNSVLAGSPAKVIKTIEQAL